MAVRDHLKPGKTDKTRVKILTVDPTTRRVEAVIKDGSMIQIAIWDVPHLFRWPLEGEVWIVWRENGIWMLGSRMQQGQKQGTGTSVTWAQEPNPLEKVQPGEAKIDADTISTASGYHLVTTGTFAPTATQSANYTTAGNEVVTTDPSSGSFAVSLPQAPTNGAFASAQIVKVATNAINVLTVQSQGTDTFAEGGTTFTMRSLLHHASWQYWSGVWYLRTNAARQPSPWATVNIVGNATVTQSVGYCIDHLGIVHLRGSALFGSGWSSGNTFFVLPSGYRPQQSSSFFSSLSGASGVPYHIGTGGSVILDATPTVSAVINLDGISFPTT